ncbi:MAG: PilZ domain-containing protein [Alphaproteobacteria bacterium]|nr:PilZ domain-containing protein [Alphaproteobacteria bacterium]
MVTQKTPICLVGATKPIRRDITAGLATEYFALAGSFDQWTASMGADSVILEPSVFLVLALEADSRPEADIATLRRFFPDAHLVVLGVSSVSSHMEECRSAGASGFLQWPIEVGSLVQLLRVIMAGEEIFVAQPMPRKPSTQHTERRRSPRRKVLKNGRIIPDNGQIPMDCTILDVSRTGARLRVDPSSRLPQKFTLMLSDFAQHSCDIVRRDGATIAVCFLDDAELFDSAPMVDSAGATATSIIIPRVG